MTDVEVFENYESEVRSYCRSFPASLRLQRVRS